MIPPPEYIIEICVAITIAIFGIAYPIIIDNISNIGDRYNSQYLAVIFNNRFPQSKARIPFTKWTLSWMKLGLFLSLFLLLFLIFKFPAPTWADIYIVKHSAKLLVLLSTITITVLFIIWLNNVALFNGKLEVLLKKLIEEYASKKRSEFHLKAIIELTYYALEKKDMHLQETLLGFYWKLIFDVRENSKLNSPLIYPEDLYGLIYRLGVMAADSKDNNRVQPLQREALSGLWLFGGDFKEIIISEKTYKAAWNNLYEISNRPDLIKIFWANSFQYFTYNLRPVQRDFRKFQNDKFSNQKEIDSRLKEREEFLELHYALGGMLMYLKDYDTIKYITSYTQSKPAQYVLLPQSEYEIIYWLNKVFNIYSQGGIPMDIKYYYPGLNNLGNREEVNDYICQYLAFLFLRIVSGIKGTYQRDSKNYNFPENVGDLRQWESCLSYLREAVSSVFSNKAIEVILDFDGPGLLEEALSKIDNLQKEIGDKTVRIKQDTELSIEKIKQFYEKSSELINQAINVYDGVLIDYDNEDSLNKIEITGDSTLLFKSGFVDK